VYIPPGMSTTPSLAGGGVFTSNEGTDLVFSGTVDISMTNLTYAFPIGITATGYSTSLYWEPSALSFLGGSNARWQNSSDYTLALKGLTAGRLNGGNTANRPASGVLAGWLATVSITFI
jgi:hypothetical protein